jgi:glutamate formiminotransferase
LSVTSIASQQETFKVSQFILSDPNFSDGTRKEVIEAIVGECRDKPGVKLIGYEPDADFDRLPVELLGRPDAMREALLNAAAKAYELIDMEQQHCRHPRIGAVDTIEIYPAKGITIEECRAFAEDLGNELFKRHGVPIYFTGKNARRPDREGLTVIRKGNYEGLREAVLTDPSRAPDLGPARLHPTAGATIIGALEEHDAYFNVVLDTTDLDIAKKLASYVRGRTGGFTNIQGVIGLPQTHRRTGKACTIVSCEVSNPTKTPLHRIYNLLKAEAARYGVNVIAGQVCGTIAAEVLVQTAEWYLQLEGINGPWDYKSQILENHLLELDA